MPITIYRTGDTMRKARAWRDGSVAQIAVRRGPESSETAVNTGIFVVRGAAVSHHGAVSSFSPHASLP